MPRKSLWAFCRPYLWQWVAGFALSVGNVACGLAVPRLVGWIIDDLRSGTPPGGQVTHYGLLILLASAAAAVLGTAMRFLGPVAARRIAGELRAELYRHLTTLEPAYFQKTRTGDLLSRFSSDVSTVQEMLGFGVVGLVNLVLTVLTTFYFMFRVSTELALWVLPGFPLVLALVVGLLRVATRRQGLVQAQLGVVSARVQENVSGVRLVKASSSEAREEREFQRAQDEYQRLVMRYSRMQQPVRAILSFALSAAVAGSLALGARYFVHGAAGGPGGLTLGSFTAFITYLAMLLHPLYLLGHVLESLQRGSVSWERVRQVLAAEPKVRGGGTRLQSPRGDVVFEDVGLTVDGRALLEGVSFRIPPGKVLGLTGRTGAGKSLVGALLARALDPTSGRVLIDGVPATELELASLRDAVSVVSQEPFLFSRTLGENISLGRPRDPARERSAAATADLLTTVEGFDKKFDTVLGERGVTLSGGQRQRTALARALARQSQILILDDALSAVDVETEARILAQLKEALAGRTLLLIGHRISTLRHADEILVLDRGRVVERGSHRELLERGGVYAGLEQRQRLSEALADG